MLRYVFIFGIFITCASAQVKISGIYPHLAMSNREGECGTGAVVPWADRLWVVTYAPHMPKGSTDKLYEITPDLKQIMAAMRRNLFWQIAPIPIFLSDSETHSDSSWRRINATDGLGFGFGVGAPIYCRKVLLRF